MWVFHIKIRFDTENFLHCEFDPCSPGVATTEPGDMVNQYTLRTSKKRVKFLEKFFNNLTIIQEIEKSKDHLLAG